MTSGPVIDVTEIIEDIKLGMMRPVFEDAAVPRDVISSWLISSWLEVDFAGAVVKGAFGKVNEYKASGAPLGLVFINTEA